MSEVWRCEQTGHLVGTDTAMIVGSQCECQGCRAARTIADLRAQIDVMSGEAFAATNPANWQKNDTPEERLRVYAAALDKIADAREYSGYIEKAYRWGYKNAAKEFSGRVG